MAAARSCRAVALDDFRIGYASVNHLKPLQVDA
jgi:sensor c-di-GMP phosphodiesterase-like protein